jgi:hypothetical protein
MSLLQLLPNRAADKVLHVVLIVGTRPEAILTFASVLDAILQPELYPELYGNYFHKVRIEYYPPRGDAKEGWDNIDIFGWLGYPMQIKINFLCG